MHAKNITELIPGKLRRVPMTGIRRRKLMATGKNPLKKKRKINTENEQNVVTGGAGIRHNFGSRHETIIFGSLLY